MQLGDRPRISENQIMGYSVFDHQGYLLGQVMGTQARPDDRFALVVEFPVSDTQMDELIVESHLLKTFDPENRAIYTSLDFNTVVPASGKTISLVAEKPVVRRQRQKVGEIVVRKVVETDWVQIPIHREKLVVERVGQAEPITEVNLNGTQITGAPGYTPLNNLDEYPPESLGQWSSPAEALKALRLFANDEEVPPFSLRVNFLLKDALAAEKVSLEFPSPQVAAQMLPTVIEGWRHQVQGVYMEKL